MFYMEIFSVCSQIHTKHKFTLWAERTVVECHSGSAYSNYWATEV